jgi:hypothetical protein
VGRQSRNLTGLELGFVRPPSLSYLDLGFGKAPFFSQLTKAHLQAQGDSSRQKIPKVRRISASSVRMATTDNLGTFGQSFCWPLGSACQYIWKITRIGHRQGTSVTALGNRTSIVKVSVPQLPEHLGPLMWIKVRQSIRKPFWEENCGTRILRKSPWTSCYWEETGYYHNGSGSTCIRTGGSREGITNQLLTK